MNRECVLPGGAGSYPLQGDVKSSAGSSNVIVTGLQGISIQNTQPNKGALLQYNEQANQWQPSQPTTGNQSVQVNGVLISMDYIMTVNVDRPIKINGV